MKLVFILALLIGIISCSSNKPDGKTEAEVLFKEGEELMRDKHYILATEKFNQLRNQYPYSFYATPAELKIADAQFLQESYIESAASYMMFRDFHPKHKKIDYVVYRIAESYFKQIPDTFDRDLESAVEAIKYYTELVEKYPKSKYSKSARTQIEHCEKMLRSKEKYVADFYFKTKLFSAARWRYLDILKNYKNKDLVHHSALRVIESSYALNKHSDCMRYAGEYKQSYRDIASKIQKIADKCEEKIKLKKARR
jgi:outer membrane protein assembly factor BamD